MKLILLFTIAICFLYPAESLPKFIRGRYFNKIGHKFRLSSVSDQYFDQRLDHFDESLKTTWKQVENIFIFLDFKILLIKMCVL